MGAESAESGVGRKVQGRPFLRAPVARKGEGLTEHTLPARAPVKMMRAMIREKE